MPCAVDRAGIGEILEALRADDWAPGSRFVKRDGGRWVWLGDLEIASGVVGLVIKGRARSGIGPAADRRAIKQAIGARRLGRAGVLTSEPIALLDVRLETGGRERWFVLRALQGQTLAQAVACGGERPQEEDAELARRSGALVRTLCQAGLFNRDHKASNLIVTPSGEIGVVDTVAIRRRPVGALARRRMLLAMCKELSGIGVLPGLTQMMRCVLSASDDAHGDWRWIAQALRDAGDTTPRVDPFSAGS